MRRFGGASARRFATSAGGGGGGGGGTSSSLGRSALWGVAAFGVGSLAGIEAYLYLFAPPHRSHWELLRSVTLAALGRDEKEQQQQNHAVPVWSNAVQESASRHQQSAAEEETDEKEKKEDAAVQQPEPSEVAPVVVVQQLQKPEQEEVVAAAPVRGEQSAVDQHKVEKVSDHERVVEHVASADYKHAVAVLSAQLEEEGQRLRAKSEELEASKLDYLKLQREMERKIAVIRQDMEAEYASALESRVEIERIAAEDRKNRDLSVEIAHQEKILEEAIKREEKKMRAEAKRDHSVRMEALRDLYDEIVAAETTVSELTGRLALAAEVYAAAETASKVHDGLRLRTPFGKSSAKALSSLSAHPDSVVREAVSSVPARVLDNGVATDDLLFDEFDKAAKKGVQVSLLKNDKGLSGLVTKALGSLVRPAEGMVSGTDADAVLARARVFLERDNLGAAMQQLEQLKPEVRVHLSDFLVLANDRLILNNAISVIKARARILTRNN